MAMQQKSAKPQNTSKSSSGQRSSSGNAPHRGPSNSSRPPSRPGGGPRTERPHSNVPAGDNRSRSGGAAPLGGRGPEKARPQEKVEPQIKEIELPPQITVRELADKMGRSPIDLIKELMNAGIMANINQVIDYDTAAIVAEDMGFKIREFKPVEPVVEAQPEEAPIAVSTQHRATYSEEELKDLRERPPVVTILGHVDHGKTSLLDVIRSTNVTASEAGGITQHIGAYQIQVQDKSITFLDTPGHAAFTAMRARGASVTDIAVLVVAADDGVQPQTIEAINHARAAHVPIIVAINKMDLATANPDHVKNQLAEQGLVPEDWGGDTICVPVSAKTKMGIDSLLDMILLVAEMAEFKANPRRAAEGVVIESRLDRSRGPMATLLVQEGVLKPGDALLIGQVYGKIRAMYDYRGRPLKRATPSTPVVVMGLKDVPAAGDTFTAVADERVAREMAEQRMLEAQVAGPQVAKPLTLEDIYARAQAGSVQALNLILKCDVQGSIEPIKNSLEKLDVGDLRVKFIHQGIGNIGESDVMLAIASQAIIVGFSVGVEPSVQRLAEAEGISIRTYDIIYRLIEDIQLALTGMLAPEYKEVVQGQAVVRQVFSIPRMGKIAGCQVREGKALRNASARVKRNGKVLFEGKVASLKRFTEDVREVSTGLECGVGFDGFSDLAPDDTIEFYTREQVKAE